MASHCLKDKPANASLGDNGIKYMFYGILYVSNWFSTYAYTLCIHIGQKMLRPAAVKPET